MVLATGAAITGLVCADKGVTLIKRHEQIQIRKQSKEGDIIAQYCGKVLFPVTPPIFPPPFKSPALTTDLNIKEETDRCVMCGLCLPHCPTYLKTQNESESPRGRLSLMRALATGELALTEKLQGHLESCLLCRACEAKCPSKVNYAAIMDATRITMARSQTNETTPTLLETLTRDKTKRRHINRLLWLADKSGLRAAGRGLGITQTLGLARLEQLAPPVRLTKPWRSYYPATIDKRADVALFTGCFSDMFDQQTLEASITLLNRLGYGVHIPTEQNCCGALHYHKGDASSAEELARQNRNAFADLEIEAIISTASGCTNHLQEHGPTARDINEFLATTPWPDDIQFKPFAKRVAVHDPCSLRNTLKAAHAPYQLLKKIPQLEIIPLAGNERCCGAAGSYMIDHPQMADRLREDKVKVFADTQAELLLTANIGCALHLASGLRLAGLPDSVWHPATLLAKQLSN